jgi:hypothetical protein
MQLISVLTILLVLVNITPSLQRISKGVGSISDRTPISNCTDLKILNLDWYYNWLSDTICSPTPAQFIPMIWGPMFINQTETVDKKAAALLGFNEPDLMPWAPKDMADLWPQMEATGLRLGSPAPSAGIGAHTWLDQFFGNCTNCRVDFIAIHWYSPWSGTCDTDSLVKFINFYVTRYNKPIWLTEFDCADGTFEQNLQFLQNALPVLEKECPTLERIAWYTTRPAPGGGYYNFIELIGSNGQFTSLGDYYSKFQFQ